MEHKDAVEIHVPYMWAYATAVARLAATGFVATDVGKLARQTDFNTLWMLTDHSPITWVRMSQQIGNVIVVAAAGADYDSTQDALDAASANSIILVYPGTYTDTINFSANNQCVIGMSLTPQQVVQQADAVVVNFGAHTGCRMENIKVQLTAATTSKDMITGSGDLYMRWCHLAMTTAAAIATEQQPSCLYTTGTVDIFHGTLEYNHSGVDGDGATGIRAAIRLGTGADVHCDTVKIDINGSNQHLATTIAFGTGDGMACFEDCDIEIDDTTASLVTALYHTGSSTCESKRNNIHVTVGAANIGHAYYLVGTCTMKSSFCHAHIVDGGGSSKFGSVGNGTTLISHFDEVTAADGTSVVGTFTRAYSPSAGNLDISGVYGVDGVQVVKERQAHVAAASESHTLTDPGDAPADADALRDDLVANIIPELAAALDALGVKINDVNEVLEAHGLEASS